MENYRPVSIPPAFSGVFEHCFLNRMVGFLARYNIISPSQHGFWRNKSTSTAVHAFLETVIDSIDAGEVPTGIFCDLSRAFDCVDHKILLEKMLRCEVRGLPAQWVMSYLSHRKQCVSITHREKSISRQHVSSYRTVNLGVPQGSVLGPILFLIFINDIPLSHDGANFTLYADDTTAVVRGKTQGEVEASSRHVMEALSDWFSVHRLFLNFGKTHHMQFHTVQRCASSFDLCYHDKRVESTSSIKFLGLYIDDTLTWRGHCSALAARLSSIAFQFRALRGYLSLTQLKQFYHAQVASRLAYGVCFWGSSSGFHEVFIAQKRIIRIMAGVNNTTSCKPIFKDFCILTACCLYICEMCVFVFNNKDRFLKRSEIHNVNTRQRDNLHVPHARLGIKFKSCNNLGPKLFNMLPLCIRQEQCFIKFKRHLKRFLVDNSFYSVQEFLTRTV